MPPQRFHVLACDYDGTLATHGRVDGDTLAALEALRATGRRLVMVTGRRLEELLSVFPEARRFDRIVAENGALCFDPTHDKEEILAEPPPELFVETLVRRGVGPIEVGRAIVATWEPHEGVALKVIRDLGLGLQIILNKGAVMILPGDVSKATGLAHALRQLGFSPHNTAAVGDAENDHALLAYCGCGAAVSNAVQALKDRADVVLEGDHGAGVVQLISQLIDNDLATWSAGWKRHDLNLGPARDGAEVAVAGGGSNVVVEARDLNALQPLLQAFTQQLSAKDYQWCAISDVAFPEYGDDAITLGTDKRAPSIDELKKALESPQQRVRVNGAQLNAMDRTPFLRALIAEFAAQREAKGRPHWLLWIDQQGMMQHVQDELKALGAGQLFAVPADQRENVKPWADHAICFVHEELSGAAELRDRVWRYGVEAEKLWFARPQSGATT